MLLMDREGIFQTSTTDELEEYTNSDASAAIFKHLYIINIALWRCWCEYHQHP
jgi:hypothetical protein